MLTITLHSMYESEKNAIQAMLSGDLILNDYLGFELKFENYDPETRECGLDKMFSLTDKNGDHRDYRELGGHIPVIEEFVIEVINEIESRMLRKRKLTLGY